MNSQDNIESNLEWVQAALAMTATRALNTRGQWLGDTILLRNALAASRRLQRALFHFNESGSDTQFGKARTYCSDMRTAVSELNPGASLPMDCFLNRPCELTSSPRTVCWLSALKDVIALQAEGLDAPGGQAMKSAGLTSQSRFRPQVSTKP